MDTSEVLQQVPALKREWLYAWDAQGYVYSNRSRVGEGLYRRRDYPPEAVDKLKRMIKYYRDGMSPRKASEKADREISEGPTLFDS